MARTLTVPPQVIPRLREGAHLQLAHAAYEIASSAIAWHKDAAPHEDHHKMEQLWALLDTIGWAGATPDPVELDPDTHSVALLIAIGTIEPNLLEWLTEMPDEDERKPGRTDELHAVQQFAYTARRAVERTDQTVPTDALAIPPMLIDRVREGAYGLLAIAAETIVRSAHAHAQPEPTSRPQMENAWALLAKLGWTHDNDRKATIELDIAEHGAAVHAATATMIPLLTDWLNDLDPNDTTRPDRTDELQQLHQFAARTRQAITST